MLFRSKINATGEITSTALKIDLWECVAATNPDNRYGHDFELGTWYVEPWPEHLIAKLVEVARDRSFVYWRLERDIQYLLRWATGDHFQIPADTF